MFDVFMKITGGKSGEMKAWSENTKHQEWIDVLAYQHSMESPVSAASGTASGKVQFRPILIRKKIDAATPLIFKALSENENLKEVLFEFWTSGATGGLQKYLDIKLTNGRVVSSVMNMNPDDDDIQNAASTGRAAAAGMVKGRGAGGSQALVTQTIELSYETISWKYQGFKKDGASLGGPKEAEVKWGDM